MWFGGVIDTSLVSFGNIHENVAYLSSLKGKVVQNLDNYCRSDGELLGKEIEADCFPEINADVFISHSHNDEDYAQRVASWLNSQFGLLPFIDSFVWKSADRLLKIIDDKYCLNDNGKTYSYEARNLSTSYIHMMLASAISKMIDKCPLFLLKVLILLLYQKYKNVVPHFLHGYFMNCYFITKHCCPVKK